MENIHINYLAILVGVAANMALGFLWYGPIFGKAWMKEVGVPADFKPSSAQMAKSMIIMALGAFLVAWVLAHNSFVWHFMAEKTMPGPIHPASMGFSSGMFTWIGFFVPVLLNGVAFENKSWKLFGINAGYYFLNLQILGMLLAYWR